MTNWKIVARVNNEIKFDAVQCLQVEQALKAVAEKYGVEVPDYLTTTKDFFEIINLFDKSGVGKVMLVMMQPYAYAELKVYYEDISWNEHYIGIGGEVKW